MCSARRIDYTTTGHGPRLGERAAQLGENREVRVQSDALDPVHSQGRNSRSTASQLLYRSRDLHSPAGQRHLRGRAPRAAVGIEGRTVPNSAEQGDLGEKYIYRMGIFHNAGRRYPHMTAH